MTNALKWPVWAEAASTDCMDSVFYGQVLDMKLHVNQSII